MIENEREKMIEPIGERLRKLMDHYHLNMNRFSIRIGLKSNSVITRVMNAPHIKRRIARNSEVMRFCFI